ncbi:MULTISPECIES: hypothetical protein [unclassified Rhizobium]|uniref:hypothetical protein n=1 Tax=unclassified Rhizobium TaxID=2613769 RepID=UPI00160B9561|nr:MULTISPECIES: hypothetical protein [unclassified Rhizobium]MBB3385978.1 hypothetical protein [Rhizobium sp. BK098]MBB3617844.1 hypothetical protein [Rhizobium sp. BK609]MBB3683340.1 hypothetical protein [Rhizobium sp. BK612]
MPALLVLFLKKNWLPIVIGLAVVAIAGGLYLRGRSDGRAIAEADARQATFNQLKERSATDAKVKDMSDADLCRAIGGELRDGRCE